MDDPVYVLLEEPCPIRRSRAHVALGQQAMSSGDVEVAGEHLREALDLDPTDETPKRLLGQLEESSQGRTSRRKRSWWPF